MEQQTEKKQSMYDIIQGFLAMEDMLIEEGGEITEEIAQGLQINRESFEAKMVAYQRVVEGMEAELAGLKPEMDYYKAIIQEIKYAQERKEKKIGKLKARMVEALQLLNDGKPLLVGGYRFGTRKNTAVEIVHEIQVPAVASSYEVVVKVNGEAALAEVNKREGAVNFETTIGDGAQAVKDAVRDALEASGFLLPGVEVKMSKAEPRKTPLKAILQEWEDVLADAEAMKEAIEKAGNETDTIPVPPSTIEKYGAQIVRTKGLTVKR